MAANNNNKSRGAARTDVRKRLCPITDCAICLSTFTDPRSLPCLHTFCLKCVIGFSQDKLPGDDVACPLCRQEFVIPRTGPSGLPKNFITEQIKDIADIKEKCDGCSSDESNGQKQQQAAMFCLECREKLCDTCVDMHRKVRATRLHQLVKLGEESTKMIPTGCDKHPGRNMELYCFDCRVAICLMCFVKSHKSHECSDVNEVASEFQRQMKADMNSLAETLDKCRELVRCLEREKTELNDKADQAERKIRERALQLKLQIDQERKLLLEELAASKKNRLKQIDHMTEELEQHLSFAESVIHYTEEISRCGSAGEIAKQTSILHDRVEELNKSGVVERAMAEVNAVDIKFVESVTATPTAIGKIDVQRLSDVRYTTTKADIIPGSVDGLAVLDNILLVLRRPSRQQVEVYDTDTFTLQRRLPVTGHSDGMWSCGLAACTTNKCFYVSDSDKNAVSKVDLTTMTSRPVVLRWSVGDGPTGLSVNRACNLLVTCLRANKIQEYTTRRALVREIVLNTETVTVPQFTLQLAADQYVISHSGPVYGVSIIDSDGLLLASYRNQTDTTIPKVLQSPRHLALGEDGSVFVADNANDRVLVINSSLTGARDLQLPPDIRLLGPWSLFLDGSHDRLYIGEERGRRGIVLSLSDIKKSSQAVDAGIVQ